MLGREASLVAAFAVLLIVGNFVRWWASSLSELSTKAMADCSVSGSGTLQELNIPLIVVYITVPNKETASSLATSIISTKLAACVNQVPGVLSTYWWQGKVETDEELLLIVKTRKSLLEALMKHVEANHPYSVPELIALPIIGGSESYIKWVEESTQA